LLPARLTDPSLAAPTGRARSLRSQHPAAVQVTDEACIQQLLKPPRAPWWFQLLKPPWASKTISAPSAGDESPAEAEPLWTRANGLCGDDRDGSSVLARSLLGDGCHVQANAASQMLYRIHPRGKCGLPSSRPRTVTQRSRLDQTCSNRQKALQEW